MLETAYTNLFNIILISLAVLIFLGFIRSLRGPRATDRLVAVNMIGTITITIIVVLAAIIDQEYLVDISIVYALISFLAVVVLAKVYLGAYWEVKNRIKNRKDDDDDDGMD